MNTEAEVEVEARPGSAPAEKPATLLDAFEPKDYPGPVDLWRIAVQIPLPPELSAGGIALPDEAISIIAC